MKVLLVVDVQNDFCPGGSLAVEDGDGVVPVMNALMRSGSFDLVVGSKDFHPAGHVSFASNHPGKNVFETISHRGGEQTLWPDHCVQGTIGADFHPDLEAWRFDHVTHKGMNPDIDSYSAFFDNARAQQTDLLAYLQAEASKRGETLEDVELYIGGLALDVCVQFTARDGVELGFRTHIILDGTRAVNLEPGDDIRTLQALQELGVHAVESRELMGGREVGRSQDLSP